MWLATKHGFYSIVQKPPGNFHVRARVRQDLVNLLTLVQKDLEILDWPAADYRFRIIVTQRDLGEIMAAMALALDYPNFKNQIARTPDQRIKLNAFHEIWAILASLQQPLDLREATGISTTNTRTHHDTPSDR
ncbi:MAG TPA: hypothetical protein VK995_02830 [Oceanipulchritudo sp.]|nr:hypothetical protein [Oceanipulchritudo sp.]